jgi:hypothetical protein
MKIFKFIEFVNEEVFNDTPESYVDIALKQLKKKIDKMFENGIWLARYIDAITNADVNKEF